MPAGVGCAWLGVVEWTGARYDDHPTVEVTISVAAPPAAVWAVISDPQRMPEFSSELQGAEWIDEAAGGEVGARFSGRNAHPAIGEWTTVSFVTECDPPRRFAWAVSDPDRPSASWRFTVEPDGDASRVTQWMQLGPGPSGLSPAIAARPEREQAIVFRRLQEHEANMTATLEAVKAAVEGGAQGGRRG